MIRTKVTIFFYPALISCGASKTCASEAVGNSRFAIFAQICICVDNEKDISFFNGCRLAFSGGVCAEH